METKKESLEKRAKRILQLEDTITDEEIKKAFRHMAKCYHPDKNANDLFFHRKFALVHQAYVYLNGDTADTHLLEDDQLLEELLGEPVEKLGLSYQQWLRQQFYDDDGIIWL